MKSWQILLCLAASARAFLPSVPRTVARAPIARHAASEVKADDAQFSTEAASAAAALIAEVTERTWGADSSSRLLSDIRMLTEMLGDVIAAEDPGVQEIARGFRELALTRAGYETARCADPAAIAALDELIARTAALAPRELRGVARVFTATLNLANAAEVHHRARLLRDSALSSGKLLEAADGDADAKARAAAELAVSPLPLREDSVAGTLALLLADESVTPEAVHGALRKQAVEFVLTAHPTEVNRRTHLLLYRRISEILDELDDFDDGAGRLTPYEASAARDELQRTIAAIWASDELRREKPTPQFEAEGGIAIIETVLWDAVPAYLRKLDATCRQRLGPKLGLPLFDDRADDGRPPSPYRSLLYFGSWMGGDRDGNPNVTPHVTAEVSTRLRLRAANLLLDDVSMAYKELAICRGFSPEMRELARRVRNSDDNQELYRRVLGHLRLRLKATVVWAERRLAQLAAAEEARQGGEEDAYAANAVPPVPSASGRIDTLGLSIEDADVGDADAGDAWDDAAPRPIFDAAELLAPLRVLHESLVGAGLGAVADGRLVDLVRRVKTFGLTLVPLDVRQEADRHAEALDAITRHLRLPTPYGEMDEAARVAFLSEELKGRRPLMRTRDMSRAGFSDRVRDTLGAFEACATLGPGALGAYVISQAQTTSDILEVALLQQQFGMNAISDVEHAEGLTEIAPRAAAMRVSPLFETLDDLERGASVFAELLEIEPYVRGLAGRQEIMVGYSDSRKDAGNVAASWALYESQEAMKEVAAAKGIELTFFHGKGGTVGRGGNPALYRAVLAHPPGTIRGRFRVTEQGEMITQNFGSPAIAERTLDIYTAAVLREQFRDGPGLDGAQADDDEVPRAWRERMEAMSAASCDAYRYVVRGEPRFVPYFKKATPEQELGRLKIGSRPTKRNPKGGVESLRAIPWQFAWSQTRCHLPAWLGVAEALGCGACDGDDVPEIDDADAIAAEDARVDDAALAELRAMYGGRPRSSLCSFLPRSMLSFHCARFECFCFDGPLCFFPLGAGTTAGRGSASTSTSSR